MTGKDYEDLEAVEDTIEENERRTGPDGRPFYADPNPPPGVHNASDYDPSLPVPEAKPSALDFLSSKDFPAYFNAAYLKRLADLPGPDPWMLAQGQRERAIDEFRKAEREAQAAMNELNEPKIGSPAAINYTWDKPKKPKRKDLQARIENLERQLTKLKDEVADQDIQIWVFDREGRSYEAKIVRVQIKERRLTITGEVLIALGAEFVKMRVRIGKKWLDKQLAYPTTMRAGDTISVSYDTDFLLPA